MLQAIRRSLVYLSLGPVLALAVAWAIVIVNWRTPFEWQPFHNPWVTDPESDLPFVVFIVNRPGLEWVVGCERSGTLLNRYPDEVKRYDAPPWWPPEGAGRHGELACASGWPLLCFSGWQTHIWMEISNEHGDWRTNYHWSIPISPSDDWKWESFPVLLPVQPLWRGLAVNSVVSSLVLAALVEGFGELRRRLRRGRGVCERCAYEVTGLQRCSECGSPTAHGHSE